MIEKNKIVMVLKAGAFGLLWMSVVTYTTFPQLFKSPVSFLSEQISFENTGKFLLFGIGIYFFDIWVHITYFVNKRIKKKLVIVGAFGCAVLSILIVPFSIDVEASRILPILIVGISMGWLKSVNLYFNEKESKMIG
jgi:hypothetical protein